MLAFALFLKMASGAVYGIVPFINEKECGACQRSRRRGGNLADAVSVVCSGQIRLQYTSAFACIGVVVIVAAALVAFTQWTRVADVSIRGTSAALAEKSALIQPRLS